MYLCIWYLVGLVPEEEEKSGRPGDLTPVSGLGRRGAAAQANYRFGILERLRQLPHSLSCLIPPCLPSLTATQVISWSSKAIPLYLDHACSFTWKSISLKRSYQPLSSLNNLSNLKLGFQIERYCPISQNQCSVLKPTVASISSHRKREWSKTWQQYGIQYSFGVGYVSLDMVLLYVLFFWNRRCFFLILAFT